MWLIDNYTYATNEIRAINETKQKEYNAVIIKIVISLLSYAIVIIINKGDQLWNSKAAKQNRIL